MTPGPTLIKECPHCKGHFKEATIASGNTFGARFWTDGKMEADMLPSVDWMIACPNCLRAVWMDSAEEIGSIENPFRESEGDYKGGDRLEYGITPSAESYLAALRDTEISVEQQTYIRFMLWHQWNDLRRDGSNGALKPYEITNLEALLELLDESDLDGLVTKAEINRELGRFDEAVRLLDWPDKSSDGSRIEYIRQLAQGKDPFVREFADL